MIKRLDDTSTSEVSKQLVRMRDSGGAVTLGRVLTLIVKTEPGDDTEAAIAAANEVTAPNTDDGLARVLERWWL